MKVICIKKSRFSKDELTIGKIYELFKYNQDIYGDTAYCFIADNGSELLYFNRNFNNDREFITLEQWRQKQLKLIGI